MYKIYIQINGDTYLYIIIYLFLYIQKTFEREARKSANRFDGSSARAIPVHTYQGFKEKNKGWGEKKKDSKKEK